MGIPWTDGPTPSKSMLLHRFHLYEQLCERALYANPPPTAQKQICSMKNQMDQDYNTLSHHLHQHINDRIQNDTNLVYAREI